MDRQDLQCCCCCVLLCFFLLFAVVVIIIVLVFVVAAVFCPYLLGDLSSMMVLYRLGLNVSVVAVDVGAGVC